MCRWRQTNEILTGTLEAWAAQRPYAHEQQVHRGPCVPQTHGSPGTLFFAIVACVHGVWWLTKFLKESSASTLLTPSVRHFGTARPSTQQSGDQAYIT